MCGIAGILGRVDDRNRQALKRMADAMQHRGPDGGGCWESEPDALGMGCLLAHRRLSILDLSTAADQPMVDPESGNVLVFNGEIYNFQALREELSARGHTFRSSGDTEVLLRSLTARGPAALGGLRGMFAIGMWEAASRRLILARDGLGIKPLYVSRSANPEDGWSLVFASEVRAILACGLIGRARLDPAAVASVVWNGFVAGPTTAVRGVKMLGAGEFRVHDTRGDEEESRLFWEMAPPGDRPAGAEEVREALRESVAAHLVSDVPLGIFLSGGVDSSAVANLACQSNVGAIHTFTLAFEEEGLNEGDYARRIARAIGCEHHEVVLSEERMLAGFGRAMDSLDQPTFEGINTYFMSQAVREAGLAVALVGTGGDELFGGYATFRDLPRLHAWIRRLGWIPDPAVAAATKMAAALLSPTSPGPVLPQTRWAKLPDMARAHGELLEIYQLAYSLFLPQFQRELLVDPPPASEFASGLPRALAERLKAETAGRSPLAAISVLELRCFLGERLLPATDVAGMAASIEIRLPLVDRIVIDRVSAVPDRARYQPVGHKRLLREVGLAGLDPALFDRPKSGFVLPFDSWIRRGLGEMIGELMRDESAAAQAGLRGDAVARLWEAFLGGAPGLYWSRIWALFVLITWCQKNNVHL